jgi:hypothetical protein
MDNDELSSKNDVVVKNVDFTKLKQELEQRAAQQLRQIDPNEKKPCEKLIDIMSEGAKEFTPMKI